MKYIPIWVETVVEFGVEVLFDVAVEYDGFFVESFEVEVVVETVALVAEVIVFEVNVEVVVDISVVNVVGVL